MWTGLKAKGNIQVRLLFFSLSLCHSFACLLACGEGICYVDGIVESTHVPRVGSGSFQIAGDEFSNRFLLAAPIDGYGLPNVYLSRSVRT
jgi:hypothetical protein